MDKIIPFEITYNDYEKISDDIIFLGNNIILKMNVILSRKSKLNEKLYFHNDYIYDSNKYVDKNRLITMRRSFDYYLSIENRNDNLFIMITMNDIINMQMFLNNIYRWFNDNKYKDLFAYDKNNHLRLMYRVEESAVRLYTGTTLKAIPMVIVYENKQYEGIRLYYNDTSYSDINSYKISGLLYFFNTVNLYQSAQLMINYLGSPIMGERVSLIIDDSNVVYNDQEDSVSLKKGRVPNVKKKSKSFFDKMKEEME